MVAVIAATADATLEVSKRVWMLGVCTAVARAFLVAGVTSFFEGGYLLGD